MIDAFFLAGSISFEIVVPFCAKPPVVHILPTLRDLINRPWTSRRGLFWRAFVTLAHELAEDWSCFWTRVG
jgi:hypothetical protein